MDNNLVLIEPMFTFKRGDRTMFNMGNKMFYLTDEELKLMVDNGTNRDEIISYVFQLLSKKRLADFSGIEDLFHERTHS